MKNLITTSEEITALLEEGIANEYIREYILNASTLSDLLTTANNFAQDLLKNLSSKDQRSIIGDHVKNQLILHGDNKSLIQRIREYSENQL